MKVSYWPTSLEMAPEGDSSSISRSRKESCLNLVLISMNSANSISESKSRVRVTVSMLAASVGSGMGLLILGDTMLAFFNSGRLVQLLARSTAAAASTTPKPYSWLKW